MYWSLQQKASESKSTSTEDNKATDASPEALGDGENEVAPLTKISKLSIDSSAPDASLPLQVGKDEPL